MKRNIKSIQIAMVAALGLLLVESSCTKNYEKYNTNSRALTDSSFAYDGENVGGYFPNMEKSVFHTDDYQYQLQQNLNGDIFSGYMMSGDPFQGGINNTNYALVPGWDQFAFDLGFQQVMAGWYQINLRSAKTRPDLAAVATIIKVEAMHRVTDIYGPIPYTKYGQGVFSTTYDSQQTVYEAFFTELDGAITALTSFVTANPGATPFAPYDNIFNGDYKEWLKFANSLRLRLAIRISMVDPTLAKTEAEKSCADPNGLMISNSDDAFLVANNGLTFTNPVWICDISYTDIQMGAPMECFLKGYNDPRVKAEFLANSSGDYRGIRQGVPVAANGVYGQASFFTIGQYDKVKWMTAAETAFNRAEGVLRGWNMGGGSAQSYYEQGVQLSMDQQGVSIGSYLSDATSTEAPYTDLVSSANNVAAGSPYLSTVTIAWNEADTYQRKLERIITQKWLAGWPDGEEAWAEYRRTNYPVLMPVVVNNSNGTINSLTEIRRLPFAQDEVNNNGAAVQKAITLLGGPDNGGTRLWWDLPTKN